MADPENKDLTGIFQLPEDSAVASDPPSTAPNSDSIQENEFPVTAPETANSSEFQSFDFPQSEIPAQLTEELPPEPPSEPPPERVSPIEIPDSPNGEDLKPISQKNSLHEVKNYSEKLTLGQSAASAAFPFSVLIEGQLRIEEREKLITLIKRENMGIREIDIEPQLAHGRILIPRISEYAAISIVQALRGIAGQIKLGPADTIFSTADTRSELNESPLNPTSTVNHSAQTSEVSHPAENLPVTSEHRMMGNSAYEAIDTITATAVLKSSVVEVETTTDYQEILEALQRELKYKAYRKGATAILNFKIQLNSLSLSTHYRLHVSGLAVKSGQS